MIHQIKKGNIEIFMRSLLVRYSMYFNKRYERVGSLFQGPYKSIIIDNDDESAYYLQKIESMLDASAKIFVTFGASYPESITKNMTPPMKKSFWYDWSPTKNEFLEVAKDYLQLK